MNIAAVAKAFGRARRRVCNLVRPNVEITSPPNSILLEEDVPIAIRDGTVLRANVFRPYAGGLHPVLMSAHPYGKAYLPSNPRRGYGGLPNLRVWPQSKPFTISASTGR